MLKPMIKKGEKKVNPCKDESVLKQIASKAKKWVFVTVAAGLMLTSLASCSQEPTIPSHVDPTPPGPVQPDDPTPISQYKGYRLYIENLTLEEKNDICDMLQSKYKNNASSGQYMVNEEVKYRINTEPFCDDEYLSILNDIECENGSFSLNRTLYKLTYSNEISKEQMQYVLDNLAVRNAEITIDQRQNSSGNLYFTITIDNLLDLYQRDSVMNFFKEMNMTLNESKRMESETHSYTDKTTLENYYSGKEEPITVKYSIRSGPYQGMEDVFELFNESGENRNPYIDAFYNGANEITPPENQLGL